ncbi:MAG: redox-regulated ATPase YchF [Limnochordales bacterium]|nr:redox-regulated ATPase YchF [Limnochordales bacterium]
MHELATGIVGLPNAGKSTLFNSLVQGTAAVAPYPFCTIEPNVGVVPIPDPTLVELARLLKPEKVTPATTRFIDIAGLVKNASRGEGLGNQFLGHIRQVDAIAHVLRCFESSEAAHIYGSVDPIRDAEIVETELLLADLETLARRQEKLAREVKSHNPQVVQEKEWTDRLAAHLAAGEPARTFSLADEQERRWLDNLFLLTAKPMIYVANLSESDWLAQARGEPPPVYLDLERWARARGMPLVAVSAALEMTLAAFAPDEAAQLRDEMGIASSGLERLVLASLEALRLVRFYTVKGIETRAWLVPAGTKAPQAAGQIHSDMERGFIKAEVISAAELLVAGSFAAARERGWVRSEGKEYEIQDGDVVLFRFAA